MQSWKFVSFFLTFWFVLVQLKIRLKRGAAPPKKRSLNRTSTSPFWEASLQFACKVVQTFSKLFCSDSDISFIGPFLRTTADKKIYFWTTPTISFIYPLTPLPHFSFFRLELCFWKPNSQFLLLPLFCPKRMAQCHWPTGPLAHHCCLMFPTFLFFLRKRTIKSSTFVFFCILWCYCSWRNYIYLGDSTGKERKWGKNKWKKILFLLEIN